MPSYSTNSYEERSKIEVPDGDYPFTVLAAEDRISKTSGNDMIDLQLACEVGMDRPLNVYENLVFTEKSLYKIKQFLDATGMKDKYTLNGSRLEINLEPDECIGAVGVCHLEKGEKYMEVAWFLQKRFTESPNNKKTLSKPMPKPNVSAYTNVPVGMDKNNDIPF